MNGLQRLLLNSYHFLSRREIIVGEASELGEFCLPINQKIVIGTPLEQMKSLIGCPDTFFKIERVSCNSPCGGFVYLTEIKLSNIHLTFGTGAVDSSVYSSCSAGIPPKLSCESIVPAGARVSVFGRYSGFVPSGFVEGSEFNFNVTFHGTAYTFDRI